MYISLGKVIQRFVLETHQYAEDTELSVPLNDEDMEILDHSFRSVRDSVRANKFKLNPDDRCLLDLETYLISNLI